MAGTLVGPLAFQEEEKLKQNRIIEIFLDFAVEQINLRGNPGAGNGVWAGGATPGTGGTAPGGGSSGYPSP